MEEISRRTHPYAPHFYSAQIMRMAYIMAIMCSILILGPLYIVRAKLGGWQISVVMTALIYAILLTLYAMYLNVWMRKSSFRFFPDYIDISQGVFRRVERTASFMDIQKVYIRQGIFERMGNLAHLTLVTGGASGPLSGDQAIGIAIDGLSIDHAHKLAKIIYLAIHPERAGSQSKPFIP